MHPKGSTGERINGSQYILNCCRGDFTVLNEEETRKIQDLLTNVDIIMKFQCYLSNLVRYFSTVHINVYVPIYLNFL